MKLLLLDAGWLQTAYLIADLFSLDFEVVVAAPSPADPDGLGRYCRQITSPEIDATSYRAFLAETVHAVAPDLVIPLCEPLQQLLWTDPIPGVRLFPDTTPAQRGLLADRRALYAFAERLGVPVPRSITVSDASDIEAALATLGTPCVLRGTQGMSGEQVRIVASRAEADAAYRELASASPEPPFAQEFIDGRRCLIGALFDHGRPRQWFSQCTIECSPAPTGPSIRIRSLVDERLNEHARKLFHAFEWDGLACAEFLQLGPGDYRFLEINPRPWAAIQAAKSCGVPLLRLFAEYLAGRPARNPIVFAEGQDCTLFPAFLTARIRTQQFPRATDAYAYWQLVQAMPWSRPRLLRHFGRLLLWAFEASRSERARQAAAIDAATPSSRR